MALYTGPGLPISTDSSTDLYKFPQLKQDVDLIRDSIMTILLTRPGERLFLPQFGCRLKELVFEPNDALSKKAAEQYITSAISTWEPRVVLRGVQVDIDENMMSIHLQLLIKKLNIVVNLPIELVRAREI